jgi:signal transduction histidine kinase
MKLPRLSITQKFIGYLILFSFIPLVVVGIVSYTTATDLLREETERHSTEVVNNHLDYLELQQKQIESLIANISGVETIRDNLQSESASADTFTRLSTQEQIGSILNGYINIEGLVSIDIFTIGGTHYSVGETLLTDNVREDVKERIFVEALRSDQQISWIGIEDNTNADSKFPKVVTAATILTEFNDTQQSPLALLIVNFDVNVFYNHLKTAYAGEDGFLLVIDNKGRLIYHPDKTRIGQTVDGAFLDQLSSSQTTLTATFENESMSISYVDSEQSGWIVVSLVPLETFSSKSVFIRNTTLLTLLISFLIVIIVAYIYNRDVVAPIRGLIARFKRLQDEPPNEQEHLEPRGHDEIGELIQWFNLFLDNLMERHRVQQEREQLIEDLRVATQKAEESARLKSEFLAIMSHELRTPLNAIEGFTSIMLGNMGVDLPPKAREMMARVSTNSRRLLELINDILDLSRLEAGRMQLALQPMSPSSMADRWQTQLGGLAEQKQLTFEVYADPQLPRIMYGDEHALSKIVINLLGNAIKFTHQGKVSLALKRLDDSQWIIEVRDTGIGIAPESHELIFEEFRQVDQSSKRTYGGTGLGLAIVKRLVIAMGGSIVLQSELGKGSTFTITLPIRTAFPQGEAASKLEQTISELTYVSVP